MLAYNFASTGESATLRHLFQKDILSSDSDDDDYTLEKDNLMSSSKRKFPSEPGGKKRRRRKIRRNDDESVPVKKMKTRETREKKFPKHPCPPHNKTWASLPVEVLCHVFRCLLPMEKGACYLCRCAQVCSSWYAVASQPISWQGTADFSFMCGKSAGTDNVLEKLCSTKLMDLRGINLSGWTFISKIGVSSVTKYCRKLQYFNLSHCKSRNPKITSENIVELAENLMLSHVNFSDTNIQGTNLLTLVNIRGEHLKYIDFSQNLSVSSSILSGIYKHCHNLEVLNLSNTSVRSICFISLQKACCKLKELYLANLDLDVKPSNYNRNSTESPGFPQLKILSLAKLSDDVFCSYADRLLRAILHTSSELSVLDIRGNQSITEEGLQFPSISVERLFLSRTKLSMDSVRLICEKWSDTLWDVDLSWNDVLDAEFDELMSLLLTSDGKQCSKLRSINVSGTSITDVGVKTILLTCISLEWLDLSSCRGVARGNKRCHDGREAVRKLKLSYAIDK